MNKKDLILILLPFFICSIQLTGIAFESKNEETTSLKPKVTNIDINSKQMNDQDSSIPMDKNTSLVPKITTVETSIEMIEDKTQIKPRSGKTKIKPVFTDIDLTKEPNDETYTNSKDNITTPIMPVITDINLTKVPNNETHTNSTKDNETQKDKTENSKKKIELVQRFSESILFNRNFYSLSIDQKSSINKFIGKVKKIHLYENIKKIVITIEGHTDSSGRSEVNQKISERRANNVKEYIEKLLFKEDHIAIEYKTVGKGEENLIDNTNTTSRRNRCAVITVKYFR